MLNQLIDANKVFKGKPWSYEASVLRLHLVGTDEPSPTFAARLDAAEATHRAIAAHVKQLDTTTLHDPVSDLEFQAGAFRFRGGEWRPLTGKPLEVLKAFYESTNRIRSAGALQKNIWQDNLALKDTVKCAVSDARDALRKELAKHGHQSFNPLPNVVRGRDCAWKLELPPR